MALNTAQAALFAELFAEADTLLKRMERLAPELQAAQDGLTGSSTEILAAIDRYRVTIAGLTEQAQRSAIAHIVERTNAVCESSLAAHTDAMKTAARASFDNEVGGRLANLASALEGALAQTRRNRRHLVATHSLVALLSAAGATALLLHLVPH